MVKNKCNTNNCEFEGKYKFIFGKRSLKRRLILCGHCYMDIKGNIVSETYKKLGITPSMIIEKARKENPEEWKKISRMFEGK